jgi:hypothetical protein
MSEQTRWPAGQQYSVASFFARPVSFYYLLALRLVHDRRPSSFSFSPSLFFNFDFISFHLTNHAQHLPTKPSFFFGRCFSLRQDQDQIQSHVSNPAKPILSRLFFWNLKFGPSVRPQDSSQHIRTHAISHKQYKHILKFD